MASGEYVSVSSQADVERAALAQEERELQADPEGEKKELAEIYMRRGLDRSLAGTVARKLSRKDALAAHARDELGISDALSAKPLQAALASAISFSAGAAIPLGVSIVVPLRLTVGAVYFASLLCLICLGAVGAYAGGSSIKSGALRVGFWGAVAMAVTAGIGLLTHTVV
jgi:VIT1/CCC1 family predicted Fe2+/Mn2+ transporter